MVSRINYCIHSLQLKITTTLIEAALYVHIFPQHRLYLNVYIYVFKTAVTLYSIAIKTDKYYQTGNRQSVVVYTKPATLLITKPFHI